jgi:hypothetical protein
MNVISGLFSSINVDKVNRGIAATPSRAACHCEKVQKSTFQVPPNSSHYTINNLLLVKITAESGPAQEIFFFFQAD